jgi:hypothetical protein
MSMSTPSTSNNDTNLSQPPAYCVARVSSSFGDRSGLSLLCCLPDGLLRQAVLPFLKVEELVQLDSATFICVPAQRARLLLELAGTVLDETRDQLEFKLTSASLAWLLRRRVGVRQASVHGDCDMCVQIVGVEVARVVLAHFESLVLRVVGTVGKLLRHCKNLRCLRMYAGSGHNVEETCRNALEAVAVHCTGLQTLSVSRAPVSFASILRVAQGCPGLTVLQLHGADCTITEAQMTALSQHCAGLTELGLPTGATFSAASVAIIANFLALQKLHVSSCMDVTDEWVTAFSQRCTDLREFRADARDTRRSLIDVAMRALALNCPELRVVDLCGNYSITDQGITYISQHCPNLEWLDVSWCYLVSDVSMVAIAQRCKCLRTVYLGSNDGVTDASINALSLHCPSLDTLRFNNKSRGVTESALVTLAQRLPGLQELQIHYFPATTDALILAVAQNCAGMKSLTLDGCGAVTEASIELLLQNCRALGSLWITGLLPMGQLTVNVSEEWARALPQAHPQLSKYFVGRYARWWSAPSFVVVDPEEYLDDDDDDDEDYDDDSDEMEEEEEDEDEVMWEDQDEDENMQEQDDDDDL